MLPRKKGGVVDERLVVYGTRNLRVVDASIIPIIPQANTQSTVYAVAERAADLKRSQLRGLAFARLLLVVRRAAPIGTDRSHHRK